MNPVAFISAYILWHYSSALSGIATLSIRALWFMTHFFSLSLLLRTLFSPWKRLHETYQGGLNLENLFSIIVVNTLMRIVGALFRIVVIAIGVICVIGVAVLSILFFVVWLLAPLVIITLFSVGISLL